jgi:hypothetical protein
MDEDLRTEIVSRMIKELGKAPIDQFEEILQFPHLLTVFRLESSEQGYDIDVAILQALLKAKKYEQEISDSVKFTRRTRDEIERARKNNFKSQLRLSLTWDRADIARNYIFSEEISWEVR